MQANDFRLNPPTTPSKLSRVTEDANIANQMVVEIICGFLQKAPVLHVSDSSFLCLKTPRCIEVRKHLLESLLDSLQKAIRFWNNLEPLNCFCLGAAGCFYLRWLGSPGCFCLGAMGCFLETICALKVLLRALWKGFLWATLGPMLGEAAGGIIGVFPVQWVFFFRCMKWNRRFFIEVGVFFLNEAGRN